MRTGTRWRPVAACLLALLTLASAAPLLLGIAAGTTASFAGCPLDEGAAHRCLIGGLDWGDTLYTGYVLTWLMAVTWPGLVVAGAGWLVFAWTGRRRRRTASFGVQP